MFDDLISQFCQTIIDRLVKIKNFYLNLKQNFSFILEILYFLLHSIIKNLLKKELVYSNPLSLHNCKPLLFYFDLINQ